MHITVIGCGRWGSLIAWYLDRTGHRVTLYGRPGSRHMQRFLATRQNDLLTLPESIALSTDLACVPQAHGGQGRIGLGRIPQDLLDHQLGPGIGIGAAAGGHILPAGSRGVAVHRGRRAEG